MEALDQLYKLTPMQKDLGTKMMEFRSLFETKVMKCTSQPLAIRKSLSKFKK